MRTSHFIYGRTYRTESEVVDRLTALVGEQGGNVRDGEAREEWNALNELRESMRAQTSRVRSASRGSGTTEDGARTNGHYGSRTDAAGLDPFTRAATALHDEALRTVERCSGEMSARAADHLDRFVRKADPRGAESAYVAAVGNPSYLTAFSKLLRYGAMAPTRMTRAEIEAVQAVSVAEEMRAPLAAGADATGGFAVPLTIDPSIMLTSDGAANPMREIARVVTISTTTWRGVASTGVVASFDAEAEEVSDDSPTLVGPDITPERLTAFVPYSIEIGQDWTSIAQEIGEVIRDARDVAEADAWINGDGHGTNEPHGVISGVTNVVTGAGTAAFAIADAYSLENAIPARFKPRSRYIASGTIVNVAYRFAGGGSTEPPIVNESRDRFLGKPLHEVSTMPTAQTTGNFVVIGGDWRAGYVIVDRLGMQIEVVQHLFGASRRPTGQRGFFALSRTSGEVVNANALRALKMK